MAFRVAVLYWFVAVAAAATNNSVITRDDVDGDILDTICTIKLWEEANRELDFCREDGVPNINCSKLLIFHNVMMNKYPRIKCNLGHTWGCGYVRNRA